MSIYIIIYTYSITSHFFLPLSCLLCVAECCSVLQCVAVCWLWHHDRVSRSICNTLQQMLRLTLSWCHSQHTATHCNTLQHTATHCNTLQHTATHCNTLSYLYHVYLYYYILLYIIIYTYIQIVLHNTLFHTTIVSIYIITCTESVTLHSFIPLLWFIKETYTERDLYIRKETNRNGKRPVNETCIYGKSNKHMYYHTMLWFIKETYIHGKRPIHTERDQQKRKETCKWDLHLREKQ